VNFGATVNATDGQGRTIMSHAISRDNFTFADWLQQNGAGENAGTNK
jgi:hypothetical protein